MSEYALARETLGITAKGPLKKGTIDSLSDIISEFNSASSLKPQYSVRQLEKFAYMLATVQYEVGDDMIPITESLNYKSAKRIMEIWPKRFPTLASAQPYVGDQERLGNKVYGLRLGNGLLEGFKYRGRGIGAQLTGYEVYKKFGDLLNIDLVKNPDLALDTKVGAKILYTGSMDGLFTGKKLAEYITEDKVDYVNARHVINADVERSGQKVANLAEAYYKILKRSVL